MPHDTSAIDNGAGKRTQILQDDMAVLAQQSGMLPPHSPIDDTKAALGTSPDQYRRGGGQAANAGIFIGHFDV